jgi:hypothetical protein
MGPSTTATRLGVLVSGVLVGVLLVAAPVLGVDPSPSSGTSASPSPSAEPDKTDKQGKPGRAPKVRIPEVPVTRAGTVARTTDADGDATYTLTVGGTTYELHAGPSWWWGDKHPLAAFVGKHVEIAGGQAEGSNEIDVKTVDGTAVRGEGRPPWAGGWKVVGEKHPGWAQWKADRAAGKGERGHGRAGAPGQLKDRWSEPAASPEPG